MINSRKKGFTLVELVIVIAVIAVLAAVLIPTFSSLVKKANLSADQQAVRQINTLLATEFATEKPEDLRDIVDMLDANGYRPSLTPLSKDYVFAWDKANNKIVLVLESEANSYAANLADGSKYYNEEVTTSEDFVEALNAGSDITLSDNVVVDDSIVTLSGDVTIDMNRKNLDASASTSRPFALSEGATLTINADGSTITCGLFGLINIASSTKNANIIINGGTFIASTNFGCFIKVREGNENINITLNNVNYIDNGTGYIIDTTYKGPDGKIYGFGGNLTLNINGGNFVAPNGMNLSNGVFNLKNASITANENAFVADDGSIVNIDNCEINQKSNTYKGTVCAANGAQVTISNSKIKGEADYAYAVLNTGGTIIANNNTVETADEYFVYNLDSGKTANIKINGVQK